jgi:hypothetical protein
MPCELCRDPGYLSKARRIARSGRRRPWRAVGFYREKWHFHLPSPKKLGILAQMRYAIPAIASRQARIAGPRRDSGKIRLRALAPAARATCRARMAKAGNDRFSRDVRTVKSREDI